MRPWPTRRLGELTDILFGFAFDSAGFVDSGDLPVVRIRDVVPGTSSTFYRGEFDKKYVIQNEDILIGMDGEFNRARWKGGAALLNQRVCRIAPSNSELFEGYLFHFLPEALKEIERATPFVTVKHLSAKGIREISIPLPPLPEQRRIAGILNKADALRAKRRTALAQLDTLAQSIFLDMFGDPASNPKKWPTSTIKESVQEVQIGPFGSLLHEEDYVEGGIPLVNPMHIHDGTIVPDPRTCVTPGKAEQLSIYRLRVNDVVMGRRGEMGRVAVVHSKQQGFVCGTGSLFIRPNNVATSLYIAHFLSSSSIRRQLERSSLGATLPNLNSGIVGGLVIPIPPLGLQESFSDALAKVGALTEHARGHLNVLNSMFVSLQHCAFRGELTAGGASKAA